MYFRNLIKNSKIAKNKLLMFTVFLLFTIIVLITVSLFLFISQLQMQNNYGKIINISGRQRMISQKISKNCLLLSQSTDSTKKAKIIRILKNDLIEFKENNFTISNSINSNETSNSIRKLQVLFTSFIEITEKVIVNNKKQSLFASKKILGAEAVFLTDMNKIVNLYEKELELKQFRFKYFIIFSNISLILIFIGIILLLIIPTIKQSQKIKEDLKLSVNELATLNKTKDKFFRIVAHDLINPFNSLMGFSDLLKTNYKNYDYKEIEQILEIIYLQSKNTFSLLENLLEWAKTQTGDLELIPSYIDVEKLFETVETQINSVAETKKIILEFISANKIIVFADNNMLKSILRNLITNAIKYSNPNSTVQIYSKENDKHIEFTVSDKGIGLENKEKENLFTIKTSSTKLGTADEKGTGLGLLICAELVKKHGGDIWVESEFGIGSDFKFTIPFNQENLKKRA